MLFLLCQDCGSTRIDLGNSNAKKMLDTVTCKECKGANISIEVLASKRFYRDELVGQEIDDYKTAVEALERLRDSFTNRLPSTSVKELMENFHKEIPVYKKENK